MATNCTQQFCYNVLLEHICWNATDWNHWSHSNLCTSAHQLCANTHINIVHPTHTWVPVLENIIGESLTFEVLRMKQSAAQYLTPFLGLWFTFFSSLLPQASRGGTGGRTHSWSTQPEGWLQRSTTPERVVYASRKGKHGSVSVKYTSCWMKWKNITIYLLVSKSSSFVFAYFCSFDLVSLWLFLKSLKLCYLYFLPWKWNGAAGFLIE